MFGPDIQDLGRLAREADWGDGAGSVNDREIVDDYIAWPVKGIDGKGNRIGWDAGNGAGGPALEKLVKLLPGEHHCSTPRSTATSPTTTPTPRSRDNLADLKKLVAEKNLDFGIAFDGDADRIGAVDGQGRVIWGDQLLIILAGPVLKDLPGATSSPTSRPARPCSTASPRWAARRSCGTPATASSSRR